MKSDTYTPSDVAVWLTSAAWEKPEMLTDLASRLSGHTAAAMASAMENRLFVLAAAQEPDPHSIPLPLEHVA